MARISFDEWFDFFNGHLDLLGYSGPIDRDDAEEQYDNGEDPKDAADALFEELGSGDLDIEEL